MKKVFSTLVILGALAVLAISSPASAAMVTYVPLDWIAPAPELPVQPLYPIYAVGWKQDQPNIASVYMISQVGTLTNHYSKFTMFDNDLDGWFEGYYQFFHDGNWYREKLLVYRVDFLTSGSYLWVDYKVYNLGPNIGYGRELASLPEPLHNHSDLLEEL